MSSRGYERRGAARGSAPRAMAGWLGAPSLDARKFLAACLALAAAACAERSRAERPNLLLVSIDTLRADHVGAYGYARATTPHLDRLAQAGHRFEHARSVMPTTLPAHAAMFTSLYPAQMGVEANGDVLPPGLSTVAEELTAAGYVCAAFVSAVPLHPETGIDQGFELYDHPQGPERPGDRTCDRALEWLSRRAQAPGEQPFFCFVHLYDPHTWYTAPSAQREAFGAPDGRQPREREYVQDRRTWSAEERARVNAAYDAEIAFADLQLGRLLERLRSLGRDGDTAVIVTSDHGETLDEWIDEQGYAYDHGEFLHERELRVPLVVRLPASADALPQGVHTAVVSSVDIKPTLLELADVASRHPGVGRSLLSIMRGRRAESGSSFSARRKLTTAERENAPHPLLVGREFALATAEHLFIRCDGRAHELYELRRDPACRKDILAQEPALALALEQALAQWVDALAVTADPTGTSRDNAELLRQLRVLGYATEGAKSP